MAVDANVESLYKSLRAEWTKKPKNLQACKKLLADLKIGLAKMQGTFLPTTNEEANQQQLLIARNILEVGAQCSVDDGDIPSFERYMAQLKCYYLDYAKKMPPSEFQYPLLGLNLLMLLSQNRVAEFHMELELLPVEDLQNNLYIHKSVELEQWLMEGSYNKIFLAKGNVPAERYTFFMDILLSTVRNEIASCIEKAYKRLSLQDAARKLNLTDQEVIAFGAQKNWRLGKDNCFTFVGKGEQVSEEALPSTELIEQVIEYARELEKIV